MNSAGGWKYRVSTIFPFWGKNPFGSTKMELPARSSFQEPTLLGPLSQPGNSQSAWSLHLRPFWKIISQILQKFRGKLFDYCIMEGKENQFSYYPNSSFGSRKNSGNYFGKFWTNCGQKLASAYQTRGCPPRSHLLNEWFMYESFLGSWAFR